MGSEDSLCPSCLTGSQTLIQVLLVLALCEYPTLLVGGLKCLPHGVFCLTLDTELCCFDCLLEIFDLHRIGTTALLRASDVGLKLLDGFTFTGDLLRRVGVVGAIEPSNRFINLLLEIGTQVLDHFGLDALHLLFQDLIDFRLLGGVRLWRC